MSPYQTHTPAHHNSFPSSFLVRLKLRILKNALFSILSFSLITLIEKYHLQIHIDILITPNVYTLLVTPSHNLTAWEGLVQLTVSS